MRSYIYIDKKFEFDYRIKLYKITKIYRMLNLKLNYIKIF